MSQRGMITRRFRVQSLFVIAAGLGLGFALTSGAVSAQERGRPVTSELARSLFDRVSVLDEPDGCRVTAFDTERWYITIGLRARTATVHSLRVATARSGRQERMAGDWALLIAPELERECPSTLAAIAALFAATSRPNAATSRGNAARADTPGDDPQWMKTRAWLIETVTARHGDRIEIEVAGAEVVIRMRGRQTERATLRLTKRQLNPPLVHATRHFFAAILRGRDDNDPDVESLASVAEELAGLDGGWIAVPPPSSSQSLGPLGPTAFGAALVALIVMILRRTRVSWTLRLTHLLPATIQAILFAYWALYWPGVAGRIESIALQLLLAYAIDATVASLGAREWKVGAGPIPIVLSSNLFAWFSPIGSIVVVVLAVVSRALIRRGGRHIMNPSAFGLTVAGLGSLVIPALSFETTFHQLNVAPNMRELIVLLALVPQVRLRIVLVSASAAAMLSFLGQAPGLQSPSVLLMFALFATDPATMPRRPVAQVMFGAFIGAGVVVFSRMLHPGADEEISKAFSVPIANMLVPVFEEAARRFERLVPTVRWMTWNVVHVALWLMVIGPRFGDEKRQRFEAALHWSHGTPLVTMAGPARTPRCEENPVFCKPLTFWDELAGWRARSRASARSGRTDGYFEVNSWEVRVTVQARTPGA